MICLDTHTWYWLAVESPRLPVAAKRAISRNVAVISTTSIWELAFLIESGRLRVRGNLRAFIDEALGLDGLRIERVNSAIAVRAAKFGPLFPGDPADRLIAATAIELGVPLATADGPITASGVVQVLWD